MIEKQGNEYILKSKDGKKTLGKFKTREEAEKREKEIMAFKESDEFESILEFTLLREAKKGAVWDVVLIEEGVSKNGNRYSEDVLRQMIPILEGAKAYASDESGIFDHFKKEPDGGFPRAVVGYYDLVRIGDVVKESGEVTRGLVAKFHVLDNKIRNILHEAWQKGKKNLLGLSINIGGFGPMVKEAGRMIRNVVHVFAPPQGASVDVVTNPSAGGGILNLVESFKQQNEVRQMKELLKRLKESAPGLYNHISEDWEADKIQEAIVSVQTKLAESLKVDEDSKGTVTPGDAEKMIAEFKEHLQGEFSQFKESLEKERQAQKVQQDLTVYLRESLDKMKTLPDAEKAEILEEYSGRVETKEDVDKLLTKKQDKYASLKESNLFVPGQEHHTEVKEDEYDKLVSGMTAMLLGETVDKINPMPGLHESYRICNPDFNGSPQLIGRNLLRESAVSLAPLPEGSTWREAYLGEQNVSGHQQMLRESRSYGSALKEAQLTTSLWGEVFGDSVTRALMKMYDRQDLDDWRKIVSNIGSASDFRTMRRIRIGGFANLSTVSEGGTYTELDYPTDQEVTFAVAKRGNLTNLTLESMVNDDLGAVQQISRKLAVAAAQTLYEFVFDFINDNGAVDYDAVALFNAAHSNTGTTAITAASLEAAFVAMLEQTEQDSGKTLRIRPKYILGPAELDKDIWEFISGTVSIGASSRADTVDNWFRSRGLEPAIIVSEWTDANNWYLVADPAKYPTMEVAFLNGRQEPELFIQDQPTIGSVFTADKITYKIRHVYGGDVLEHRSFYGALVT